MNRDPNARISWMERRQAWRVRVLGHPAKYFSTSKYVDRDDALAFARLWRDDHWDGTDHFRKLTPEQFAEIRDGDEHYVSVAARYGISPTYVHKIRKRK